MINSKCSERIKNAYFAEVLAVARFIAVTGRFVDGPGWPSVERTRETALSKGQKNGIGGSSPVVDFLGAGAGFARDSRRAEGPTAGPNTEFLEVGSGDKRTQKSESKRDMAFLRTKDRGSPEGERLAGLVLSSRAAQEWVALKYLTQVRSYLLSHEF